MNFEKEKIFVYYKRLISRYPQDFRERFGESMEQTFNDVCSEQKGKLSLTFVFSTFAETSIGVIKENLSSLKGAYQMNYWLKTISIAALLGSLVTAALFVLAMLFNHDVQAGASPMSLRNILSNWIGLTLVFTLVVSGLRLEKSLSMKDWLTTFGAAALFGLLLIAPFALMEYWNTPAIRSGEVGFPVILFFGLWIMPVIFFVGASPTVRSVRAGESVLAHPISLVLRVIFLALLAIGWLNLIRDQMPCFLGVPNCD